MTDPALAATLDFQTVIADTALLQQAAHYRTVRKTLRRSGLGSLFFGFIAVGMGIATLNNNPLNIFLLLIGLFLLVEGSWLLIAPSPPGIIVDGVAFLILGSWNIFITIMNVIAAPNANVRFGVVAIMQIAWGCHAFVRYARYSKIPMVKPARETMAYLDEIAKQIGKAKPGTDPALIQITTSTFIGNQIWKGKLLPSHAILVTTVGHEFLILSREQFRIDIQGKVLIGKTLKATVHLDDRHPKGTLSPDSYQRFTTWQANTAQGVGS